MPNPETNQCIFEWLKDFFNSRIEYERQIVDERDRRYMTMFEDSEKAVIVALRAINERLGLLNESRSSIADLVNNNPTRIEMAAGFDTVNKELKGINARLDRTEGAGTGKTAIWGFLVGGIGLLAIIIMAIDKLVKR